MLGVYIAMPSRTVVMNAIMVAGETKIFTVKTRVVALTKMTVAMTAMNVASSHDYCND